VPIALRRAMAEGAGIGLLSTNASNLSQKETIVAVVVTWPSTEKFVRGGSPRIEED
jgi:hypothetical protein